MSTQFDPLPEGPFDIVIADPPWEHPGTNTGPNRSVGAASYPIVKLKDLCALPVSSVIAERAQLYLWTSGPVLMYAPQLASAWGFERYATIPFVWDKMKRTVGWYTLPQTELVLLFVHGKGLQGRGSRNEHQIIYQERMRHSVKPSEAHERIERMYPTARRLELFARRPRDGWAVWGNDIQAPMF